MLNQTMLVKGMQTQSKGSLESTKIGAPSSDTISALGQKMDTGKSTVDSVSKRIKVSSKLDPMRHVMKTNTLKSVRPANDDYVTH